MGEPLLLQRRIEHMVVEWNPHEWHKYRPAHGLQGARAAAGDPAALLDGARFIHRVASCGYRVETMRWGELNTSSVAEIVKAEEAMVPLALKHHIFTDLHFELEDGGGGGDDDDEEE